MEKTLSNKTFNILSRPQGFGLLIQVPWMKGLNLMRSTQQN
jgi:hypothetical protein